MLLDSMRARRKLERTEKTMRKNGLKWSNISVKKYHQRPGLGVRSGSVRLGCCIYGPYVENWK